jgi:quercetin dioxygenase-like cupin family protein
MSTCEVPGPGEAPREKPISRIHRFQPASSPDTPHRWSDVPLQEYKPAADHHCGVIRSVLVGDRGEATSYQVRYFEIAPQGFTTREHHVHEHTVVILRGQGEVRLGDQIHALHQGDVVYVAPNEVHQFRNLSSSEPLGFLCLVDRERDRPIPVAE